MPFNPNDPIDVQRLWGAHAHSRDRLNPFRKNRTEAIRQHAGHRYGDQNAGVEVPVNWYELAHSIYTQLLVGNAPRAYTATENEDLLWAADDLKAALDYTAERTRLEVTLERLVADALHSVGICKLGMAEPAGDAWWSEEGEPFVSWIDLDDWVHDMTAKTWEQIGFCGNKFRVPFWRVMESDEYDRKARRRLKATPRQDVTRGDTEAAETISGGAQTEVDQYEDEVELWEFWLRREKLLLTLPEDDEGSPPLKVVEWEGPATGMYQLFGFGDVSSNIMPLPPSAIWLDVHDLANELFLKLGRQAKRQQSLLPVRGGSDDDVERIRDAGDGGIVRVDGEVPQETSYGGPSAVNLNFFGGLQEVANRHFGNLDTLGGLSSRARTLGQEEMMGESAGGRLVYMRRRLERLTDWIFTGLAHYLYRDPLVSMNLSRPLEGTQVRVPVEWNPEKRGGNSSLFQVAIEPYSTVRRDPRSQFELVMRILRELVLPVAPEAVAANMETILKMAADKLDLPELKQLFFGQPVQPQGQGQAGMPAETTRNYVRQSAGGGPEPSTFQAATESTPQANEFAALMRSAG